MEESIIRKLQNSETDSALSLVWNVFSQFEAPDYSEEGIAEFRRSVWDEEFLKTLTFYGAFIEESLVSVIATRSEGNHIALFFTDSEYQRKGIGKELFRAACKNNQSGKITVNSSPFALPVYHALGFTDTDTEKEQNGIRYTPMVCILHDPDCPCKRTKCERHGDCMVCREHHKTVKGSPVHCERIREKERLKAEHKKRRGHR